MAPTIVKKYGNRRLYDTGDSRYVTLDELATKVRSGVDVKVIDAQTGEELTQATLAQIILEGGQAKLLPVPLLTQLVRMLGDEAARAEVGRDLILERLAEILLIEALRAAPARTAAPGLLRGLTDPRIAAALRDLHGDIACRWTIPDLARAAGMSRSAFFERFTRLVGMQPMTYLATWRMAVAKDLLRQGGIGLEEVAARVGYGSASAFSTAFSRHSGRPPGRFADETSAGT